MANDKVVEQFVEADDPFEQRVLAGRLVAKAALQFIAALIILIAYVVGKVNGIELNGGFELVVGTVVGWLFGSIVQSAAPAGK